jgi:O-antigen/teichoic acid export membrane protein/Mrp family chromosome partitioning ATPase
VAEGADQVRGLARGGGLNLAGAIISQVANVGTTLLIARLLGRSALGTYAQAFAFLSLLVPLSIFGLGVSLTRFVAIHLADGDQGAVRGTIRTGVGVATTSAGMLGTALFAAAPWLVRHAFHDPSLAMALRTVAITLPVAACMSACLAATQGYRTMKPSALISLVYQPLAQIGGSLLLVRLGLGVRGAMLALFASYASGCLLALVALGRVMRKGGKLGARPVYRPGELFRFSLVAWLAVLASYGLIWADTILLGMFRSSDEVGVYNVATRLVVLATFVMAPITSAFAPRIADLHHRGRSDTLRHTYQVATGWIVRLSLPAFVAILAVPRDLLGVFGPGFRVGAAVTMILAAGKLIDAATGPCGMMLNMTGRPAWNMADNIAVLVSNVALNLLLIPRYGLVGSAVAWAVSLGLVNVARVSQVWKGLRMLPFGLGELKALIAAGVTFPVALFAGRAFVPPLRLPLTLAVIVVAYLALSLLMGISQEDRLILDLLRRRRPVPAVAASAAARPASSPARPPVVGRDLRPVASALWETEPWPLAGPGASGMLRDLAGAVTSDPELLDASWTVGVGGLRRARPRPRPPFSPARQAATLWRRKALLAAGLLAGAMLGAVALPRAVPLQPGYEARIRLDVKPLTAARIAAPASAGDAPEALVHDVRSAAVAAAVLARLGPDAGQLDATRGRPPASWPQRLLATLHVRPVLAVRQQLELSYVDRDRRLASEVVTSFALRYASGRNAADRSRSAAVVAGFQAQAEQAAAEARRWQQQAAQERASTGVVSAATQARLDLADSAAQAAATQLTTIQGQIQRLGAATVAHPPAAVARQSLPVTRAELLGFGVAFGLAVAVAVALLLEAAVARVVSRADAEAACGIDVVAALPHRRGRSARRPAGQLAAPVVERQPRGGEAAAYQQLAGTLRRRGLGGEVRVLAVSAADAPGATRAVLVNLAHTLAGGGHPVLLLSCDPQAPPLEEAYGLPGVPGLGEYLAGAVAEAELVGLLVTVRPNLMLLPAGMAWAGVPLLDGTRAGNAVDELRHTGLTILLETPGSGWPAESLALTDAADATLLVTRSRASRWKAVAAFAEELRRDYFSVLGVVLTDTRGRRARRLPAAPWSPAAEPPPPVPRPAAPPATGPAAAAPAAGPSVAVPAVGVPEAIAGNGHANGHSPVELAAGAPSNGQAAKPERPPAGRAPGGDAAPVEHQDRQREHEPRQLDDPPGPRPRHERWR